MPLYEYICRDCQHRFETLVTGSREPSCPTCHGQQLEKQLSVFAVSAKGASTADAAPMGACGSCGDPRGPGSCRLN
jgi:putative FmdB family regulatory protein